MRILAEEKNGSADFLPKLGSELNRGADNQTQAVFIPLLKTIEKNRTALPQEREFSRVEFGISLLKVIRRRSFPFYREHGLLLNNAI